MGRGRGTWTHGRDRQVRGFINVHSYKIVPCNQPRGNCQAIGPEKGGTQCSVRRPGTRRHVEILLLLRRRSSTVDCDSEKSSTLLETYSALAEVDILCLRSNLQRRALPSHVEAHSLQQRG